MSGKTASRVSSPDIRSLGQSAFSSSDGLSRRQTNFFSRGKQIHAVERDVEVRLEIVLCQAMPNFLDAIANKPRNVSKNRVSCDAARALRSKEQKAMLQSRCQSNFVSLKAGPVASGRSSIGKVPFVMPSIHLASS